MNTAPRMPNPDVAAITAPAPLRDLPAWLVWKFETPPGGGKPRKVPFWANGGRRKGRHGTPEDRRQLTTFEIAKAAAMRRGFDGVGFATLADWGVCAVDFDHCVEGGRVRQDVLDACEDTYAELSPSGQGVRAFVRGNFGNRKDHEVGFETFSTAGFVTVTGRRLECVDLLGLEDTIAEPAPALRAMVARQFGSEEQPTTTGDTKPIGLTEYQVREALEVLPKDLHYDDWVRVGMALHHESGGDWFYIWDEWSSTSHKYTGTAYGRQRWDSFGQGGQRPVTAHFLVRLANEHGAHIDLTQQALDDFDVVEEPPAAAKPLRFPVVGLLEFMSRPPPTWIVSGLVPEGDVMMLYGERSSGKSFVALDLFGAVARGVPWRGLRVKQKRIVYIAAEGRRGFRNRVVAYANSIPEPEVPGFLKNMAIIEVPPNLLMQQDAVDVAKSVAASGGADIVVIDTLAQTTPGANENSGEDMGKALAHCRGISKALGDALVVLIHHAGKDASKGARGWSGLEGAADALLEVVRTPQGRYMRVPKQKDGEDGQQWGFALNTVQIGVTDDGDVITSCVVAEAALPVASKVVEGKKLGEVERVVYEVIQEMAVAQNAGIEKEAVIVEAAARLDPPTSPSMRDTRRQRVSRALTGLLNDDDAPFVDDGDGTLSVI